MTNTSGSEKRLRILIADDHAIVREGLGAIISQQTDMELAGEATNGEDVVALVQELQPDVILMDLMMPRQDGLTSIRKIVGSNAAARILVLTSYADDERVFPAIKAGALGYMLKDAPRDQLLQAIRDVAQGRAVLHPTITIKMMRELNQPIDTFESLTPRELDTLRLIAQGLSNQSIAVQLVVDERTVAKYVSSILTKLHLANRTQAALYALRKGLTDTSQSG